MSRDLDNPCRGRSRMRPTLPYTYSQTVERDTITSSRDKKEQTMIDTLSSSDPSTAQPFQQAPKKPLNAYNLFFQLERENILNGEEDQNYTLENIARVALQHHEKRQHEKRKHRKSHGKIGFRELARWKKLDEDTKALFEARAEIEKGLYQKEILHHANDLKNHHTNNDTEMPSQPESYDSAGWYIGPTYSCHSPSSILEVCENKPGMLQQIAPHQIQFEETTTGPNFENYFKSEPSSNNMRNFFPHREAVESAAWTFDYSQNTAPTTSWGHFTQGRGETLPMKRSSMPYDISAPFSNEADASGPSMAHNLPLTGEFVDKSNHCLQQRNSRLHHVPRWQQPEIQNSRRHRSASTFCGWSLQELMSSENDGPESPEEEELMHRMLQALDE